MTAADSSSEGVAALSARRRNIYPGASPRWTIPADRGVWAYSTGDTLDQCPRGVYREMDNGKAWQWMAPLPVVLTRLQRRSASGAPAATYYRMAMAADADSEDVVLCDADEVRTGQWASRMDIAMSPARSIVDAVATAILDTAEKHAELVPLAPRIKDDKLLMPPTDVGPAGYGKLGPVDEDTARTLWIKIAEIARRTPKLALTIGVSLAGVYAGSIRHGNLWWFLTGDAGQGKTTGLRAAAAVCGNPRMGQCVQTWNVPSKITVAQQLATLSFLPGFRDELGSAGWNKTSRDLENVILGIAHGRPMGGREGLPAAGVAPWSGVLVSTGNDSIHGQITNEGAIRRVVEIETPITASPEDAEYLGNDEEPGVLDDAYGWPLHWLTKDGLDVEGMAAKIKQAEQDMVLSSEAVPRSLGKHFALAVAGTAALEDLTGITGIRDTALAEARAILDSQMAEIRERGMTADERALSALREELAANPSRYPTRKRYAEQVGDAFIDPRDVHGWDLSDDPRKSGDIAILCRRFDEMCVAHGINNGRDALRKLHKRGILLRGQETDGRLRQKLSGVGQNPETQKRWMPDVYVFQWPDDPATRDDADQEPQDHNDGTPQDRNDGDETQSDSDQLAADEHVGDGPHGPVFRATTPMGECRVCTRTEVDTWDAQGVICQPCLDRPGEPEPKIESAEEKAPQQRRRRTAVDSPRRALCGVLDTEGLWLPDFDEPVTVELPADAGAAYRLGIEHDLHQLWIHPSIHEAMGIPATREITAEVSPATPIAHQWTTVEGYTLDAGQRDDAGHPVPGLAAWINIRPVDDGRRLGMYFPAYDESRTSWHLASDGRTLRDAVLRFSQAMKGESYYFSPNATSGGLVRKASPELAPRIWKTRKDVPEPVGKVKHMEDWSRVLLEEEEGATLVDRYDINGAEAAPNTGVYVGVGEPDLVELDTFDAKAMKATAGYVLANVPRQHAGLDPRLPDMLTPWHRADEREATRGGPAWAPIELFVLLDELGVPIEPVKALVWNESRRLLRGYGERISKARMSVVEESTDVDAIVLKMVKTLYKQRIGDFNRAGSQIYRPDVRDMIKAKARANGYRSLRKIADQSGRFPIAWHVDAAYYVSDNTSDDRTAADVRPAGMRFERRMGAWKHEVTVPLARVQHLLGERGFASKFDRILKGEDR